MTPGAAEPAGRDALAETVATLRAVADYLPPPELDARFLDLGERKDELTEEERVELLAWVGFTQQRSVERARALRALQRLAAAFPGAQESQ